MLCEECGEKRTLLAPLARCQECVSRAHVRLIRGLPLIGKPQLAVELLLKVRWFFEELHITTNAAGIIVPGTPPVTEEMIEQVEGHLAAIQKALNDHFLLDRVAGKD